MDKEMDREHEIMHKVLDGDAEEEEHHVLSRSMEADTRLKKDYTGLMNTVRLLRESERREAPFSFTAGVMKKLPEGSLSRRGRLREFLFGSRVLRWNMASMLAMAVIVLVTVVTVSRMQHETAVPIADSPVQDEAAISVHLTFHSPQAQRVAVAGDFNNWKTDAQEMKKTDGNWSIDLKLKPGVYSYSFVVDGKAWVPDPGAEFYEDDGYGSRNSVMRINI
jgi:anti-sigma factor RsiW